MDMARIETNLAQVNSLDGLDHCGLDDDSLSDSCLQSGGREEAAVFADTSRGEVQDSSCGGDNPASVARQFDAECLDFVTESDVVVGLPSCLEFESAVPECGESETSGGPGGVVEDHESKNLENLELGEFLDGGEVRESSEAEAHEGNEVNSVPGEEGVGEEEALLLAEAAKTGDGVSVSDSGECSSGDRKENHVSAKSSKTAAPGAKKKAKVDWTPELHRRFVHAVEQLGVEKAFPSRILELMGVQCLTRHNIASHLQKYRSHRRHLAAREAEAASWTHRRAYTHTPWARTARRDGLPYLVPLHTPHIQPRPSMAMSTLQPQPLHPQPLSTPLKVWGYPTVDHSNVHMWQQPQVAPPSFWQAPDGSYWQHPAASYGTPYPHPMRVAPLTAPSPTMIAPGFPDESLSYYSDFDSMYLCNQSPFDSDLGRAAGVAACSKPPETHLSKEVLDAAIGEALANPWTPPPLGLKPPSMEGVIAELQRQGINTVPPSTC